MSDQTTQEDGMKQLRESRDAEKTRADAAEQGLRTLKAEVLFDKSGLNAKHAELFLKSNPEADVTAEAVSTFADEYGLVPAAGGEDPPSKPTEPPVDAGLAALGGAAQTASSGAAPAAKPQVTAEEFDRILQENPAKAAELYVRGQAPRNAANVQARELVDKGVIDH